MQFIDTHAHLDDKKFHDDFPCVLQKAAQAGVHHIITIATTAASSQSSVQLAAQHKMLFATVGIQPNHVAEAGANDWDQVVQFVTQPKVAGIGETGLDRYWDYAPFPQQEDYFARHLELARKHDLPVVIHCREAEADTLKMLRAEYDKHGPIRAVMHSFTGSWDTAQASLEMGLHISFAGMVTYKNAQNLRDVAAKVPVDRLLIETDSPYLSPVPVRGRRNEPAHVAHTAACLAEVFGVETDVIAEHTTQNARELFRLP